MRDAVRAMAESRSSRFNEAAPGAELRQAYLTVGRRLRFIEEITSAPAASPIEDAEDHQDFCAADWVLVRELVERGKTSPQDLLPQISSKEARQIMTRADFVERLDRPNSSRSMQIAGFRRTHLLRRRPSGTSVGSEVSTSLFKPHPSA
jgi:hypothetical protein